MKMIQITERKREKLYSLAEGIMSMAEKLIDCVSALSEEEDEKRSRYSMSDMRDERKRMYY